MPLPLKQVTLVCVDTRAPALALRGLLRSMAQVDFARAILFTHLWSPRAEMPGLEVIDIGPIQSGRDYSDFILRRLPAYIGTSHVLITQWDGFVVDASAWTDEFLVHDYLGAPWPDRPASVRVGNGGFSLRSRRMLIAGMDPQITEVHPEDAVLCVTHRQRMEQHHGISFAPEALARRFAFENQHPGIPTFGFHGPANLPHFVGQMELSLWLRALPPDFFRGRDARRLARAMLAQRMPIAAAEVLERRVAVGRTEPSTRVLQLAAGLMRRFGAGAA